MTLMYVIQNKQVEVEVDISDHYIPERSVW